MYKFCPDTLRSLWEENVFYVLVLLQFLVSGLPLYIYFHTSIK